VTPEKAAQDLWDVLRDIDDGMLYARDPRRLWARRNLIRAAGTVSAAADHLIEVVWEGYHSVEPPGWRLHQPESDEEWVCVRDDGRLAGTGKTQEEAIADAWREVDRPDLHAIGARMCVEQLRERNAHGDGFVLVMGTRLRPPDEEPTWDTCIVTSFGVNHHGLEAVIKDSEDGNFGLDLPDCEWCEALCRVVYEEAECDEYGRVCVPAISYLEVVEIDGKPAIEVFG
jgi:hypothetical protein